MDIFFLWLATGILLVVAYVAFSWWKFKRDVREAEESARQMYEQWKKDPARTLSALKEKHKQKLEDAEDELDEAIQSRKNWPFKEIKPKRVNGLDRSE